MKKTHLCIVVLSLMTLTATAKDWVVTSPNGKLKMNVSVNERVAYSVEYDGQQVLAPSVVSMTLADGTVLGENAKVRGSRQTAIDETLTTVAYRKQTVVNKANQLTLTFKGFSIDFRAYDLGCAYRFNLNQKQQEVIVKNELSEFNFTDDFGSYHSYANSSGDVSKQFSCSFENIYEHSKLTEIANDKLMFLPVMVELPNNLKVCITEVNQFSYPGMFLQNFDSRKGLTSIFAPYPKDMKQGGHNNLQMIVQTREDYIAKVSGKRAMPWRAMAISTSDEQMTDNDLVYCLADPCQLDDTSWIKSGKVAWDWWNDWNLEGVDFRAGINNETYRYYIDFASKYGIEYVILDEGWAVNKKADMMLVIPEIDLKALVDYAKTKNVGIILWGGYQAMDKDMEGLCKHYSEMGVKGFKVDFMDRDDQIVIDFYNRMAKTAAKYKLMVDFHGAFKPSGMNRTYPNVINYEGVHGLEQMKWEPNSCDQVTYDVTLPFVRQIAGPMDYTQGAMRNANRRNYFPCNTEPMSQGTRCHQLAEYIIFESPLNMLCDAPTSYEKEPFYTQFLANIPTVWDETHAVAGEVGKYVVNARRKGDSWYVGGLTNWDARTVTVDLSFLGNPADYEIETFVDGVNADRRASDYKYSRDVRIGNGKLNVKMQPGGGFLLKATKKK